MTGSIPTCTAATRAFERKFALADHVRVEGASHVDGMLHIELLREVPEALKPRKIAISRTAARTVDAQPDDARQVEQLAN